MKTIYKFLAVAAAVAGLTQMAQAVPQLRVFDGTTTITISDNGAGDAQGAAGQVVWVGSVGNWTLNVHTGTTFPVLGTLANPVMDLSFNATSNAAGGTLVISFTADGFGPSAGGTVAAIGGTTNATGTVLYQTYGGTNNTPFSTANLLTSQGPFGPVAFSSTVSGGGVNNAGPYSLTQVITLTHTGGGITTGDALLSVPESGTSLLLLGAGLTALGVFARIRRRLI